MKHTNWVEARTECTPEKIFDDLAKNLESDVAKFNHLHEKQFLCKLDDEVFRVHRACKHFDGQGKSWLEVDSDYPDDDHKIAVRLAPDNTIKANIGVLHVVKIEHDWNPDSLE